MYYYVLVKLAWAIQKDTLNFLAVGGPVDKR